MASEKMASSIDIFVNLAAVIYGSIVVHIVVDFSTYEYELNEQFYAIYFSMCTYVCA